MSDGAGRATGWWGKLKAAFTPDAVINQQEEELDRREAATTKATATASSTAESETDLGCHNGFFSAKNGLAYPALLLLRAIFPGLTLINPRKGRIGITPTNGTNDAVTNAGSASENVHSSNLDSDDESGTEHSSSEGTRHRHSHQPHARERAASVVRFKAGEAATAEILVHERPQPVMNIQSIYDFSMGWLYTIAMAVLYILYITLIVGHVTSPALAAITVLLAFVIFAIELSRCDTLLFRMLIIRFDALYLIANALIFASFTLWYYRVDNLAADTSFVRTTGVLVYLLQFGTVLLVDASQMPRGMRIVSIIICLSGALAILIRNRATSVGDGEIHCVLFCFFVKDVALSTLFTVFIFVLKHLYTLVFFPSHCAFVSVPMIAVRWYRASSKLIDLRAQLVLDATRKATAKLINSHNQYAISQLPLEHQLSGSDIRNAAAAAPAAVAAGGGGLVRSTSAVSRIGHISITGAPSKSRRVAGAPTINENSRDDDDYDDDNDAEMIEMEAIELATATSGKTVTAVTARGSHALSVTSNPLATTLSRSTSSERVGAQNIVYQPGMSSQGSVPHIASHMRSASPSTSTPSGDDTDDCNGDGQTNSITPAVSSTSVSAVDAAASVASLTTSSPLGTDATYYSQPQPQPPASLIKSASAMSIPSSLSWVASRSGISGVGHSSAVVAAELVSAVTREIKSAHKQRSYKTFVLSLWYYLTMDNYGFIDAFDERARSSARMAPFWMDEWLLAMPPTSWEIVSAYEKIESETEGGFPHSQHHRQASNRMLSTKNDENLEAVQHSKFRYLGPSASASSLPLPPPPQPPRPPSPSPSPSTSSSSSFSPPSPSSSFSPTQPLLLSASFTPAPPASPPPPSRPLPPLPLPPAPRPCPPSTSPSSSSSPSPTPTPALSASAASTASAASVSTYVVSAPLAPPAPPAFTPPVDTTTPLTGGTRADVLKAIVDVERGVHTSKLGEEARATANGAYIDEEGDEIAVPFAPNTFLTDESFAELRSEADAFDKAERDALSGGGTGQDIFRIGIDYSVFPSSLRSPVFGQPEEDLLKPVLLRPVFRNETIRRMSQTRLYIAYFVLASMFAVGDIIYTFIRPWSKVMSLLLMASLVFIEFHHVDRNVIGRLVRQFEFWYSWINIMVFSISYTT